MIRKYLAIYFITAGIIFTALSMSSYALTTEETLQTFQELYQGNSIQQRRALNRLQRNWSHSYVAPLAEIMLLSREQALRQIIVDLFEQKIRRSYGFDGQRWLRWVWNKNIEPMEGYAEFKTSLYRNIDPRFALYFDNNPAATIDIQEVMWGGVIQDGIPPLRNPKMVASPAEATYLEDDNIIFGIEVNGDVRAYPKRILAWHEMFTDTVGGIPVTGVYCTLCGAMVLYESTVDNTVHHLGTSGFLYLSNKLMYDQATFSLWNTLWGKPVIGPLVGKGIQLKKRSVVTTTWGEWRKRHPNTTVLSLDTGHQRDYGEGVAYKNYFSNDRLMFTVPEQDSRLKNKDEVLGLVFDHAPEIAVAYAVEYLAEHSLIQTTVADLAIVIVTDKSGASRVYRAPSIKFTDWDGNALLVDAEGREWTLTEQALINNDQALERLPAHRAFWFGWYAAYKHTELIMK